MGAGFWSHSQFHTASVAVVVAAGEDKLLTPHALIVEHDNGQEKNTID